MTTTLTDEQKRHWIGRRARKHSLRLPASGCGPHGVIVDAVDIDTSVTGVRLRYTRVDMRTASGAVVSGTPDQFQILSRE